MVLKYANHTVILHRAAKKGAPLTRVTLPGGDSYEFSAAEVAELNGIQPGTLTDPQVQGRKQSAPIADESVADVDDLGDAAEEKHDEVEPEDL